METAFVGLDRTGPGRAGPGRAELGLAMPRAETGRALNSIRARGPGREVYGPGRANKIRPVQISAAYMSSICLKGHWVAFIRLNTPCSKRYHDQ